MRTVKFDFTEIVDPAERADRINALGDYVNSSALATNTWVEMVNSTGWFTIRITDLDYELLLNHAVWFSHYAGVDSIIFRDDEFRSVNAVSCPAREPRMVKSYAHYETWIRGGANPVSHLVKGF